MSQKKVLLLGGTGAMGIYMVPELLNKGYRVYITTRSFRSSVDERITYIYGNALNIEFLKDCLSKEWDVIIDFMVYSTEEFSKRINLLLEKSNHYLFLSTYRVFADSVPPIVENSPRLLEFSNDLEYLKTDEYALSKARQENILRTQENKHWTILRPSITYSKNRFQFLTFEADTVIYRAELNLPICVSTEIMNKFTTMTWAGDVAKMIVPLIMNPKAFSEDFNVVTNEARTWREIYNIYKKEINLNIEIVEHDQLVNVVGNKYQLIYDRMFDRRMDNSKILNITGITKEDLISVEEGLSRELNCLDKAESSIATNYSLQAKIDKITRSRITLKKATIKEKIKYYKSYYFR